MAAFPAYPIPADEPQRLRDLERYGVIGSTSDVHFDRLVELASAILETPIAVISLVEEDRQWFLARKGLDATETPREMAFCAHTICHDEVLVVPDALEDERFRTNPLVLAEPHIRFYAGAPLRTPAGHNLGTLCAIDRQPRHPTPSQLRQLQLLAELVMRELELRRLVHICPVTGLPRRTTFLAIGEREFQHAHHDHRPLSLLLLDIDQFRRVNDRWGHQAGDRVLLDLSRLLLRHLREADFAGRLDDGEFALLLVDREPGAALALAEEIRGAASTMPGVHTPSELRLHLSGGLTALAAGDHDFLDLLRRADRALQLAKANGRNQVASLLDGL